MINVIMRILLLSFLLASVSSAEQLPLLMQEAEDLFDQADYQQASEKYQLFLAGSPEAELAAKAQGRIVESYIALGMDENTQSAYDTLILNYGDSNQIITPVDSIADRYRKKGDYDKAKLTYQYNISNWSSDSRAMESYRGFALSALETQDEAAVLNSVDSIADFSSANHKAGKAVYEIAVQSCKKGNYTLAESIYNRALTKLSGSDQAIWILTGKALVNFYKGDNTSAQAAVSSLKTTYSGNSDLPKMLYEIARMCERSKKPAEAVGVYQQILNEYPATQWSQRAAVDTSHMNIVDLIDQGRDSEAESAYSSFISSYSDHPKITRSLFFIGEAYYNRAVGLKSEELDTESSLYFSKALSVWEKIINEFPYRGVTEFAYYFSADCCKNIGEYDKALDYYTAVTESWPEFKYADSGLLFTAKCYENLQKQSLITEAEAKVQIRTVYQKLVSSYPDSKAVKIAQRWLDSHN